jgi:hypothetical protein
MKLSQVKALLPSLDSVAFKLDNGAYVPAHFHITEIGVVTKNFMDCGGTIRSEKNVSFQLWTANDYEHRLAPDKFLNIIELSEKALHIDDLEIEVEYQGDTIGKYDLAFDGKNFILQSRKTACLAIENCIVPEKKSKIKLSELKSSATSCCSPESNCC